MPVPEQASKQRIVFLPPMSGLASNEIRLDPGAIDVRLGEGRTAEVLRNICYQLSTSHPELWREVQDWLNRLFGIALNEPKYIPARGELSMSYTDRSSTELDLSSAGRGMQQTLLLLSYISLNPNTTILLDEPDAHLEILRQRQIYNLITEAASKLNCQIIAASHSEVILNEAAGRDVVVAFLGNPHRIDDRGSQLVKSLRDIPYDRYYQAEQTGWVLYLEGSTDLAIIQEFARLLDHEAQGYLDQPFVEYVANQPRKAEEHFHALREAKRDLVGFALFDRLNRALPDTHPSLQMHQWTRREIENYFCTEQTLLNWTAAFAGPEATLFTSSWTDLMHQTIDEVAAALRTLGRDPWSEDTKATDDFLDPLFQQFFQKLRMPSLFQKSQYHGLARFVPRDAIGPEIAVVLDKIVATARKAVPAG